MRTFQDAKAMAKSLRDSMTRRRISLSHGECLEMVAKQFGFADWNTLSAKLAAAHAEHGTAYCSFCGKSQHEVAALVEGSCRSQTRSTLSCVFICDECAIFSAEVLADRVGGRPQSN